MYFKLFISIFSVMYLSSSLIAKELSLTKELHFGKVTHNKTVVGVVKGFDTKRYKFRVRENQTLTVDLESDLVHFNIYRPNKSSPDGAIFLGKSQGKHFSGVLKENGRYMIRVFLAEGKRVEDEKTIFRMHITLE